MAAGCTGTTQAFTIKVNPTPVAGPVASQNVCNGAETMPVTFTGSVSGGTFSYTSSDTSVGLMSGAGNIDSSWR